MPAGEVKSISKRAVELTDGRKFDLSPVVVVSVNGQVGELADVKVGDEVVLHQGPFRVIQLMKVRR